MSTINTAVNNVVSPNDMKLIKKLSKCDESALLHEAMGKQGALRNNIKPAYPGCRLLGFALTVQCPPSDNLMLHKAISIARPGDVLVAAVNEFTEAGLWGEIASVGAMERGIRGLVTDGAVRDVESISRLGFQVFCAGISIKGTTKRQKGLINEPVVIGNVLVRAGDIIVGDTDGVVVVPREQAAAVIEAALSMKQREEKIIAEVRKGKLTLDLLGLRGALRELGIED